MSCFEEPLKIIPKVLVIPRFENSFCLGIAYLYQDCKVRISISPESKYSQVGRE